MSESKAEIQLACRVSTVHQISSRFDKGDRVFADLTGIVFELRRAEKNTLALRQPHALTLNDLATAEGSTLWSATAVTAVCRLFGEEEPRMLVIEFEEGEEVDRLQAASTFALQTNPGSSQEYFFHYARLDQQQNMLMDTVRTGTYRNAVAIAAEAIRGKVVMDVGTGSGILAMFCARMGARKVYAVEASEMAKNAQRLVDGNGLAGIVEIITGRVEEVEIPEKARLPLPY